MDLNRVLEGVPLVSRVPDQLLDQEVRGLAYDSRKVGPGYLFFAFSGAKTDGAQFANAAVGAGSLAVISDRPKPGGFTYTWLQVTHGRHALAFASKNFYNYPDQRLALTAITGTNGKTTSTSLIDSILRAAGKTTALIGTIEYQLAGRVLPAVNTTPESLDLFRMFHELEEMGGTHATLEASSHALDLGRIYAIEFHTAGFTNFTRDHLDYHHTMEAYFAAKQLLFRPEAGRPPRYAILNADDEGARRLEISPETRIHWYGIDQPPAPGRHETWVRARDVESSFAGLRFVVEAGARRFLVESRLVGRINVYNILLACAAALAHGLGEEEIQKGIQELARVPGRFERVEEGQPFMVVVDYAHTDDALRNVIAAARGTNPKRVITLFGCGGDRDRSKRPLMGMAAAELSDYVVLTSDNPRSEDPLTIMNDAMVGLKRYDTPNVAEPDRERAIRKAIEVAEPGDIVILAGKGHETYQVLKDGPIPFDDRETARRILRALGYARNPEQAGEAKNARNS
ncbi:MAG: UDP-N-acetylmuramoyl-L-alanyl-D-glutamate--2,6-diaminopimelate ligase [Acidobacteriaceae bacterium]|nr:UDP-N-acetylmuramoyl-L-alanyl-D-glutamate--2,6-diaminopimelate ligase [Acidobacteriaceae bacterium]MBV9779542.1 UDP-N-acetylmuramoyl-L-alanyl-D-glutamate--2,6-diaminopimelate ligase [Acidobacteriaceae bacterium]